MLLAPMPKRPEISRGTNTRDSFHALQAILALTDLLNMAGDSMPMALKLVTSRMQGL